MPTKSQFNIRVAEINKGTIRIKCESGNIRFVNNHSSVCQKLCSGRVKEEFVNEFTGN